MEDRTGAVVSIKPHFAAAIFRGEKTVELRTRTVRLPIGAWLLIYVTTPVAELQGFAQIAFVETAMPSEIWRRFGQQSAIDKRDFDSYVGARAHVSAIGLCNVEKFATPKSLADLRKKFDGFHPPQFMAFLDRPKFQALSKLIPSANSFGLRAAAE